MQGDSGAPLDPEEREELGKSTPSRAQIPFSGSVEAGLMKPAFGKRSNQVSIATTCVNNAECVFVVYEGNIAKCALQKAFYQERITFEKPISCHLYPLRVERIGTFDTLNYEQIDICAPARKYGAKNNIFLIDFLKVPLSRKFGETWYEQFSAACQERREALGLSQD